MSNTEYFSANIWPVCLKNCIFCSEWGWWKREDFITFEVFQQIIQKNYPKKVSLSGGEPLLNPRLFDYIVFCKKLSIEVSLVTAWEKGFWNDFISQLIETWLDELMISLEWPELIHDTLTQKKWAYQNILQLLFYLKNIDRKNTKIIINTNLNKLNYQYLPAFITSILTNFSFISIYHIQILQPARNALKYQKILFEKYSFLIQPLLQKIKKIPYNEKITFWRLPFCFVEKKFYSHISKAMNNFYQESWMELKQKKISETRYISSQCSNCVKSSVCDMPYKEYIEIFGEDEIKTIE